MSYKIHSLFLRNFKCFDNRKYYKFEFDHTKSPIVLTGPNGFGKTTFFDALELVFTKNITRFNTNIENKSTDLKKNIFLNQKDIDGIIVLNLINEDELITSIFVKINHEVKKIGIDNPDMLKFYKSKKSLVLETDIEEFISMLDTANFTKSLKELIHINYKKDNFNIYYYASQAESLHFLKTSISSRKDTLNVLLNLSNFESNIKHIEDNLIGKTRANKNVLINKHKDDLENKKKELIKNIIEYTNQNNTIKSDFIQLLNYPNNNITFDWDKKSFNFSDNSYVKKDNIISEINSIGSFILNYNDYEVYIYNSKLDSVLQNTNILNYYIKYLEFFDKELQVEKIKEIIKNRKENIEIYTLSKFFRTLDLNDFNENNTLKLLSKKDFNGLIDLNILSSKISELKILEKSNNNSDTILQQLIDYRKQLKFLDKKNIINDCSCPYCNYEYKSSQELEYKYNAVEKSINSMRSESSGLLATKKEDLFEYIKLLLEKIKDILFIKDDEEMLNNEKLIKDDEDFITNDKNITEINFIYKVICDKEKMENFPKDLASLKQIIIRNKKSYSSNNFEELIEENNYNELEKKYKDIVFLNKIITQDMIDSKINFIEYKYKKHIDKELNTLKNKLRETISELNKIDEVYDKLDSLRNTIKSEIESYKKIILTGLKIPMLIYTSKLLQDYQSGLGVFIDNDMRFVANGEAKHDILNTFSSGQLSAFILAFLFAMNKRYVGEHDDDFNFILVDDPVQTMDDLNIFSLIEVLRNDFNNKQIIMSTHEFDKENYILYKFLKYGILGQSFNVKDRLY